MPTFETSAGQVSCTLRRLVVAGWTGRDRSAVEHHIEELARIGVPRPSATPLFYEVSPDLATQADTVAVLGEETSGEAEPFVLRTAGRLWLGLASDHTDRWLETTSVAHSKQACPKVLARALWPFDTVAERLDAVALSTRIGDGTLYQDGTLAAIRPLGALLAACPLEEDEGMLCGTLPALGGVRPADRYAMTLRDETLGAIDLAYGVRVLPIVR